MREVEELVGGALAGDRSAFARLLERETPQAYRAALAILRSPEEARDVVQDAAIRAWQELPRLRHAAAFPAWFRRITVRRALDERRHFRHTHESQLFDVAMNEATDTTMDSIDAVNLLSAFDQLRREDRALLALRYQLDLTVPDVADTLGIKVGTAKARIRRALAKLRTELRDDDE